MGTPIENNTNELQEVLDIVNSLPNVSDTPDTVILYTEQVLTEEQKAQVRTNIGAASIADIPDTSALLPTSGGTMEGTLVAQNNSSYDTKQVRNVFLVAEGETLPAGANGDICHVYKV